MKYQTSHGQLDRRSPADLVADSSTRSIVPRPPTLNRANEPTATIEELTSADPVRVTGHPGRRLGLAIVASAALICVGFASRAWGPTPAAFGVLASSSPSPVGQAAPATPERGAAFILVSPAQGETTEGGVVSVHGIAIEPLRNVQLAVVLDLPDAVLGWLDIGVASAGPVQADIPVFALGFDVPVQLEVSVTTIDGSTYRLARGFVLGAGPRVSLWRSVVTEESGGAVELVVEGYARSTIEAVTIDVRARSGRLLGSAVAPNEVDDERPGSGGGRRLGLGSFRARIVVPGPIQTGGWQVDIAWRDGSDGSSGSAAQMVSVGG